MPVAAPSRGVDGWLRAHAPALALGALLLTTLLVGLLVGHWATRSTPTATPAAAPQVIRITGGGQAAAPAAPTTTSTPATTTGGSGATTPSKKAAPAAKSTGAKGAADVKALSKKQLDKAVKKGKPITTGSGAPPPKDNKPAAGGSDFQTIG